MDSEIVYALKKRYAHLSLLLFNRSVERSKNESELFDILDTIPTVFPLEWNATERRWKQCSLFQLPRMTEDEDSEPL